MYHFSWQIKRKCSDTTCLLGNMIKIILCTLHCHSIYIQAHHYHMVGNFCGFKFSWILCALLIHENYSIATLYIKVIRIHIPQKHKTTVSPKHFPHYEKLDTQKLPTIKYTNHQVALFNLFTKLNIIAKYMFSLFFNNGC